MEEDDEVITYIIIITIVVICVGWTLLIFCLRDKLRWCDTCCDVEQAETDEQLSTEQLSRIEAMELTQNDPPPPYYDDFGSHTFKRYQLSYI